ncbi:uncharacterized protein N7477_004421 [Penicillium maclennaniae]|uniref:uncharacterized protein n=1 Tax=Penicillium maclennaniae TaxID=1343394 RepID=UPI00253F75DE|nr:uncharacterized protein N7477_004421 [Penicillium maclennaniae]KAJ5674487.1 hypothetical protein N7477_004421 [Penicillium maclennaniae]
MPTNPQYDMVLLGPTGYTGRFCAQHIVKNHPTNLKWAIAGRSEKKMEPIAQELKELNQDRVQPDILVVQLNSAELNELAQKTKIIINCVGPYHLYSTPVVEACAANGTHYLDVTGETPWIKELIEKYHETAKSNGAIIMPSVGVESAPADMLAWALVKRIRSEYSSGTRSIESCIKEMKSSGPSGGTLATVLGMFDSLPLSQLLKSANPFSLAASAPPKDIPSDTILQKLLGVRSISDLGAVTTSPTGLADMTIVHRSSTLMPEFYGKRFYFHQFLYVRNTLIGAMVHIAFMFALAMLMIPPVRMVLRKFIFAPGQGPTAEAYQNDRLEYHAVATADQGGPSPPRVFGTISYEGSLYVLTGLLVSEAAMVILQEEEKVKKTSRCGIVTSATLGQDYVDRLDATGVKIQTRVFQY